MTKNHVHTNRRRIRLFNSDLVLCTIVHIVLKYMLKEKRRDIKH